MKPNPAKKLTPMRAIRAKCLDCSETSKEVRLCPVESCPLWVYRSGHRPKGSGVAKGEKRENDAA